MIRNYRLEADAAEAIKVAIETFSITDRERQRRLVAQRISS
jgi:hypothetical protein